MFVFAEDGDYVCLVTHPNGPNVNDPAALIETVVTKYKVVVEGNSCAHLVALKEQPDRFSEIARSESELLKLYKGMRKHAIATL